jgi:signal transduction histidine kinase
MESQSLALVGIVQKLSQCKSLDEIIAIVRTAARKLANSDGATFVLKEENLCHYVDEDALTTLFAGKHFPADICVSGEAMRTAKIIVIPDIYVDPRIPIDIYRPTFVKSLCMVPIRSEAPIGAIGTYWKETHTATAEEQEYLKALADSTSIAIENVFLQTELELRLKQVEHLSNIKNEFLKNLSHELRTPLNVILGWTQILGEDATPEELQEGLAVISQSGRRQELVIKDLLECSKIISGHIDLKPVSFDIMELLEPVLESLELSIQAKKLDIRMSTEGHRALVFADPERCKEVLWHLLSNAIKFSPIKSVIEIRTFRDEAYCALEIKDQGIGISENFLPKVFDLFTREETGMTKSYSGTGLGLSIGRYYSEAQGGHLLVESEGKTMGTKVTLKLPVAAIRFVPKRKADPLYMSHVFQHLLGRGDQHLGEKA